jgi:hypothetical protein
MKLTYQNTFQKVPTLDIYAADVKKITKIIIEEVKL